MVEFVRKVYKNFMYYTLRKRKHRAWQSSIASLIRLGNSGTSITSQTSRSFSKNFMPSLNIVPALQLDRVLFKIHDALCTSACF